MSRGLQDTSLPALIEDAEDALAHGLYDAGLGPREYESMIGYLSEIYSDHLANQVAIILSIAVVLDIITPSAFVLLIGDRGLVEAAVRDTTRHLKLPPINELS